jgi:prepilin-type N-terminal cleavage/methylation domain-containing protein
MIFIEKMITKERIELTKAARKGFTLIEILIVVAIIAILASVVLVGLGPTQEAGRDARRISDLSEAQNGLELYYNKCGFYPGATGNATCAAVAVGATGATAYTAVGTAIEGAGIGVSTWPQDPSNVNPHQYVYGSNGTVALAATSYVLGGVLENTNNSVFTTYAPPTDVAADDNPAALTCGAANKGPDYCISL